MSFLGAAMGAVRGGLKRISIKNIKTAVGGLTKGGLAGGVAAVGAKLVKRVGRKNLKRLAVGGAITGGAVAATEMLTGGGGGGSAGAGGGGRRYRRINPGNTRAMRRAIRRVESGARLFSKFFRVKHGGIKGAPNVRLKARHRRAA